MAVFKNSVNCPVTEDVLPDKLSELLEVALTDLKKCERSTKYRVSMLHWHTPVPEGNACWVCLAGSVMAKEFKLSPKDFATFAHVTNEGVQNKITLLSNLALRTYSDSADNDSLISRVAAETVKERYVSYRQNSKAWWRYMRAMLRKIKELEKLKIRELQKLPHVYE